MSASSTFLTFRPLLKMSWARLMQYKTPLLPPAVVAALLQLLNIFLENMSDMAEWMPAVSVVAIVLSMGINLYAIVLLYDEYTGIRSALMRAIRLIVPMIAIGIRVLVASYAWIPVIVLVACGAALATFVPALPVMIIVFLAVVSLLSLGIWYWPHYQFSVIILVKEGKPARLCVEESFHRTQGRWTTIVWMQMMFALCIGALYTVIVGVWGATFGVLGMVLISSPARVIVLPVLLLLFFAVVSYLSYLAFSFHYELGRAIFAQSPEGRSARYATHPA